MEIDFERPWLEGHERWEKMTTREIAVELGTDVETLYRWARLSRIPGLTEESLDARRRLDPLRGFDRGDFDPGSGLIVYDHRWKRGALGRLKRHASLEDLIETAFIRGRPGRCEEFVSLAVRDRLAFFAGTVPLALLDCQRTWFVVEPDEVPEDVALAEYADVIDLLADCMDGFHEPPFRIRPSLHFLVAEAVEDGLILRTEVDPIDPSGAGLWAGREPFGP